MDPHGNILKYYDSRGLEKAILNMTMFISKALEGLSWKYFEILMFAGPEEC